MNRQIAEKAGLIFMGKDEDGKDEFLGTDEQWALAEKMEDEMEQMAELEEKKAQEEDNDDSNFSNIAPEEGL